MWQLLVICSQVPRSLDGAARLCNLSDKNRLNPKTSTLRFLYGRPCWMLGLSMPHPYSGEIPPLGLTWASSQRGLCTSASSGAAPAIFWTFGSHSSSSRQLLNGFAWDGGKLLMAMVDFCPWICLKKPKPCYDLGVFNAWLDLRGQNKKDLLQKCVVLGQPLHMTHFTHHRPRGKMSHSDCS